MAPDVLLGLGRDGHGDRCLALAEERYWDALVGGEPVPPPGIEPVIGVVIQSILALDDAPLPDPGFAARLEHQLLGSAPTVLRPAGGLDFQKAGSANSPPSPAWSLAARRRVMSLAATAALLTIMAASVAVMPRAGASLPQDEGAFPLVLGPGITEQSLLLQARFENFPEGPLDADLSRWVMQPGAAVEVGRRGYSGEGPAAFLVEAGALTIETDGPIAVTGAGASTPSVIDAAAPLVLQTGDRAYTPTGVVSVWRNTGTEVVRILEAKIRTPLVGFPPEGTLNYTVIMEEFIPTPSRPAVMNVYQITLLPEGRLRVDSVPGLEMLKVESGRLVAVDVDSDGNPSPPVSLGQGTRPLGSFPPGRVFRSANDQPVKLILVTFANTNPLQPGA